MSPLEAATTDELIGELKRRHTAAVVAYMRPAPGDVPTTFFCVEWGGPIMSCIGLAHHARQRLSLESMVAEDADEDDAHGN